MFRLKSKYSEDLRAEANLTIRRSNVLTFDAIKNGRCPEARLALSSIQSEHPDALNQATPSLLINYPVNVRLQDSET